MVRPSMHVVASSWPSPKTAIIDGQPLLAFAGCNYLGLAHHPRVVTALGAAAERYGVAPNGSRATSGSVDAHLALEELLARWLGTPAAVVTSSGTLANFAACEVLAPRVSRALLDSRAHVSLVQAARLAALPASIYEHCEASAASHAAGDAAVLTLSDGVFAASGDCAPVNELLAAVTRGLLLVDDSHGLGVLGVNGRGVAGDAMSAASASTLVITASLAKAVGCAGGVVAGSEALIASIRESASYKGATPIAPALAKAACVAAAIAQGDDDRRLRLRLNIRALRAVFDELGLPCSAVETPIFTLVPKDAATLDALRRAAAQAGVWLPLIDYPGGPAPQYLRIAVNAEHDQTDIERLADVLHLALRRSDHKPA